MAENVYSFVNTYVLSVKDLNDEKNEFQNFGVYINPLDGLDDIMIGIGLDEIPRWMEDALDDLGLDGSDFIEYDLFELNLRVRIELHEMEV